ncbi:MAG: NusG domain II-containing protein [Acetobacterium woodii]|nr:NusG domain II-containing protein [Acetobacterium woodii]
MKKNELIIIIILLVISIGGIAAFYIFNATNQALSVRVSRQGQVLTVLPLSKDHTETFTDASGTNTLVISDGKAKITEADCPDHICVKTYPISNPGETIVCLPHKLVVEVITGES